MQPRTMCQGPASERCRCALPSRPHSRSGSLEMDVLHEPVTWHRLLRDFAAECMAAAPDEQADRIREASALFQFVHNRAPRQIAPEVECMIAQGAYERAAIALLEPGAAFTLAENPFGVTASVVLPGCETQSTAHAGTSTLALLAANASALLRWAWRGTEPADDTEAPDKLG